MTAPTDTLTAPRTDGPDKAITLALSLAQAERAIDAFAAGGIDAIVDSDGNTYLLRMAQEHLLTVVTRLKAVIESSADALTVVDRSGVIVSQSRAVRQLLGYATDELVGRSIFELAHDDDWRQLYSAFFNVIEEFIEKATVEFLHRTHDGSYRVVEATLGRLRCTSSASVVISIRLSSRQSTSI